MEQLLHFSHSHVLNLIHLQPNHNNESSDEEEHDEEEHEHDFVVEDNHVGQCNMCKEHIYSFHLSYYCCKDCNYSVHKFCAEMPTTLQNHPLHTNHNLTLSESFQDPDPLYSFDYEWTCCVCNLKWKNFFNYNCSICKFNMDIICATISQQNMDHPSHPNHKLNRMTKKLVSRCNACGCEHEGIFYHCNSCSWFWIHVDCALLPTKILIQQTSNGIFTHSHPLTLAYSFPETERKTKFYPNCRLCDMAIYTFFWLYKCDKCQYYIHSACATSKIQRAKTIKNFKDDEHPNILHCPFPDESYNLVKHQHLKDCIVKENHEEMLNHFSHQHPLVLLNTQASLDSKLVFLHNPMKRIQLLCDGCVKPITTMPFYKCSKDCDFVLHVWCAKIPSELQDHPVHPRHTLFLLSKTHGTFSSVFRCDICDFPSNGFIYACRRCDYYVDINCAFLPNEITHEAHPGHLLSRIMYPSNMPPKYCNGCHFNIVGRTIFHCASCDFYLDPVCAFLLPKMITNKYDKHALSLRYNPAENYPNDYFCEICEENFNPNNWFYHCNVCAQSIHPSCSCAILQCEQSIYTKYRLTAFFYINVKFGGTLVIKDHPHRVAFVQGMECHGLCKKCHKELRYEMIFRCLKCGYALHYNCASLFNKFYVRFSL